MENSEIFRFKGQWRSYQERVLSRANGYLADGKIHIVAAPGSGKTTLGIELIIRLNKPALVLAPSVTIRQQWESRIVEAFLNDGYDASEYISQDLKNPKLITIATYQALHSAMTRFSGKLKDVGIDGEVEENDETESESVDYKDFDLIAKIKEAGIGILCLDECHHLRNEWWKALEEFRKSQSKLITIALTATPPYDSTMSLWTRYINMCGDIDEEITVPELVKEGSLCPHQDYVYFNYPTEDELSEIGKFEERSAKFMADVLASSQMLSAVRGHRFITSVVDADELLEEPAYLASLLIYLKSVGVEFPEGLKKILVVKDLPEMSEKWMEKLIQKFLYEDPDSFYCEQTFREEMEAELKRLGLVEKRKVCLTSTAGIQKMLTSSKGKCNSIVEIARHEYSKMGTSLRMLVLTDYIRKEQEKNLGTVEPISMLGVLPFFELIRRAIPEAKLGVLCGSMVIIPSDAKETLNDILGEKQVANYVSVGNLPEDKYVKVNLVGSVNNLTNAVTELFSRGYIHIVVGTKSLLGEGWDAPCINSLILASFVGSFMLSNQMRGRAIRVFKDDPNKTSNIWHLVCVRPKKLFNMPQEEDDNVDLSRDEDFELLERRMEHFLGLHYEQDIIETGIARLSIIKPPFNKIGIKNINKKMLEMSSKRDELRDRWSRSLEISGSFEVSQETEVTDERVTAVVFWDALRTIMFSSVLMMSSILMAVATEFLGSICEIFWIAAVGCAFVVLVKIPKLFLLGSPFRRLKSFGNGILAAMRELQLLENEKCMVETVDADALSHAIYLKGGSGRDKALFAECVSDFFEEVDNQRYILVKSGVVKGNNDFYCVPEVFGKRKEDALVFEKNMSKYIGKYELVYTRSENGRRMLLKGRVKAFANRQQRCITRKRVKSGLE